MLQAEYSEYTISLKENNRPCQKEEEVPVK